eukprot:3339096-Pleurochrysis_carterae.AAC.3
MCLQQQPKVSYRYPTLSYNSHGSGQTVSTAKVQVEHGSTRARAIQSNVTQELLTAERNVEEKLKALLMPLNCWTTSVVTHTVRLLRTAASTEQRI